MCSIFFFFKRVAIEMNIVGVKKVIDLCKELKNLQVLNSYSCLYLVCALSLNVQINNLKGFYTCEHGLCQLWSISHWRKALRANVGSQARAVNWAMRMDERRFGGVFVRATCHAQAQHIHVHQGSSWVFGGERDGTFAVRHRATLNYWIDVARTVSRMDR